MFCPHCGKKQAEVLESCPYCGMALPTLEEEDQSSGGIDPVATTVDDQPPLFDEFDQDAEDLRETMIDGGPPPGMGADLHDTDPNPIVDRPPAEAPERPPLQEVLTFSELQLDQPEADPVEAPIDSDGTGVVPLDHGEFGSGTASLPPPPEAAVILRDPAPPRQVVERPGPLTSLLALLACVAWLALAALITLSYLGVSPAARFVAWLPVYVEVLVALPMALTLAAVLLFVLSPVGGAGSFLWLLLAALPGVGLLLGPAGAFRHMRRSVPLALMVLIFALCAQGMAVWVVVVRLALFA